MKYKLTGVRVDLSAGGKHVVVLNRGDAKDLVLTQMDRVELSKGDKKTSAIVDLTEKYIEKGEMGLFAEVADKLDIKASADVFLEPVDKPSSVDAIRKKIDGVPLSKEEIGLIIDDLMEDKLSEVELSGLILAWYIRGLTRDEILNLTKSILHSGKILDFKRTPVMDKHCLGGVPGNRTTMLIVPVVASAGLLIPKTSSRSISSPAGTADTMEFLARVDLNGEEIMRTVEKTNGCIAWGGAADLAAADDKLIKIRHPLSLDPEGVMMASILAKKRAVGATHVLIDIPIGHGAKVESEEQGETLANQMMDLGSSLGMKIRCILTPGYDPIGQAVGPALEAREVLRILEGQKVSLDLMEKSITMAGIILEMGGKARPGEGARLAQKILESGKALEKMKEIIECQGGNPEIASTDIEPGKYEETIKVDRDGRIRYADVKKIAKVARIAGAPENKRAGLYLYVEKGDKVKKGQPLLTVYSETSSKLSAAMEIFEKIQPIEYEKVILEEYSAENKPIVYKF